MTGRTAGSFHVLVTAAWAPELERFRELVGSQRPDISCEAMGIGLVDAAIGMTRCVASCRPTHVLALGTAGAAPRSGLSIGDVVVGEAVKLVEPAVVEGRAALPYAGEATFDSAMVDAAFAAGARPCAIANTLAVTTDDALASKLALVAPVEHLEAYAVARACEALGVPCAIVLGIANIVGAGGREQWRRNHVAASARAAEVAFRALPAIGR